jgi:hypothetical protein
VVGAYEVEGLAGGGCVQKGRIKGLRQRLHGSGFSAGRQVCHVQRVHACGERRLRWVKGVAKRSKVALVGMAFTKELLQGQIARDSVILPMVLQIHNTMVLQGVGVN